MGRYDYQIIKLSNWFNFALRRCVYMGSNPAHFQPIVYHPTQEFHQIVIYKHLRRVKLIQVSIILRSYSVQSDFVS